MRAITSLASLAALTSLATTTTTLALPSTHPASDADFNIDLEPLWAGSRRAIVDASQVGDNYDFVICGGGLAGLVLASRLSEDANKTVLVLEAGDTGYAVQSSIDVPGNAYYSSLLNSQYDWQYKTEAQTNLGNRELSWPRGKVLGGSTAVNGLYLVRPSEIEVNSWANLSGDSTQEYWGWNNLFTSMKKSEKFTPPTEEIQAENIIEYDLANHGANGPLDYSYPGYLLPVVGEWTTVLEQIGIETSPDPNGGQGWGGFIATSSINPTNWTRSYARSAYIDALPPRSNLVILPNARVLKVETTTQANGTVTATGVTYGTSADAANVTVKANKEVIVSGGAIGSPQMLLLSGIGPKADVESVGIQSVLDLPGVGQHVQDHLSTEVIFKTTAATAASEQTNATLTNGTESFFSFVNSAIAYANITNIFGDWDDSFKAEAAANLTWYAQNELPSKDDTVIAGFTATYQAQIDDIVLSPVGQVELLLGLTGTSQGGDESIAIQAALQHPFSRGQIYLNSSNPWSDPVINPNYFSHPADLLMLREGLKLARSLGKTAPLAQYMTSEVFPGTDVSTDAEWDAWIPTVVGTEYHPSCSCSMLPLDKGGVVDTKLIVHGTSNLRVIDASVFPTQFAAHLMAPLYGLAERAADIIKADYGGAPIVQASNASASATETTSTASQTATATGSAASSGSTTSNNNSASAGVMGVTGVQKNVLAGVVGLVGVAVLALF